MSENYLTHYQLTLCELLGLDPASVESLEVRAGVMTGMRISAEFIISPSHGIVLQRTSDRALEVLRELMAALEERPIPAISERLYDAVTRAARLLEEVDGG